MAEYRAAQAHTDAGAPAPTPDRASGRLRAAAALAVLAALLLATVVGCAGHGGGDERVTIRFMQNKREVIDYFDEVIARFERENPDIHVVQDNNEAGFVPSLVRGSPPDVTTRGWAFASADIAKKDVFEDLSDLQAARLIDPRVQALVDEWGRHEQGATVALPFSLTAAGVIYNKDLFEQHGVEVPTTWSEFVAACENFKAAGVTPIYGTYKEPWTVAQGVFDYATGGVTDITDFFSAFEAGGSNPGPGAATFANTFAAALPVMDYLRTSVQPNAPSRGYPEGNVAFANGEAAMYLQGPWALTELAKANPDVRVGTFPLPVTDNPDDRRVRVNVDMAVSIPKGAAHPREARRFVEFLFRGDVINAYNADNAAFSTLADAPPQTDERIAELDPYVDAGRYYQGANTYLSPSTQALGHVQSYALDGDGPALLATLDEEWQRIARRNDYREIN
ncbi:MAG TPA: extracellular solute-binding protein [Aldersonia sp.]